MEEDIFKIGDNLWQEKGEGRSEAYFGKKKGMSFFDLTTKIYSGYELQFISYEWKKAYICIINNVAMPQSKYLSNLKKNMES